MIALYLALVAGAAGATVLVEARSFAGFTPADLRVLDGLSVMLYATLFGYSAYLHGLRSGFLLAVALATAGYIVTKGCLWLYRSWEQPEEDTKPLQRDFATR